MGPGSRVCEVEAALMPRGGPVQDGEVKGGEVHAGVGGVGEVG